MMVVSLCCVLLVSVRRPETLQAALAKFRAVPVTSRRKYTVFAWSFNVRCRLLRVLFYEHCAQAIEKTVALLYMANKSYFR